MFPFSGEILALVLARKDAIAHWRRVIGPTQTAKARDETPDRYLMFYTEDTFFSSFVFFGDTYEFTLFKCIFRIVYIWLSYDRLTRYYHNFYPRSIRALFGTDNQRNAVHGSDSPDSAVREIHFFFPNGKIADTFLREFDVHDGVIAASKLFR